MTKWLLAILVIPAAIFIGCSSQDSAKTESTNQSASNTEKVAASENNAADSGGSTLIADPKPKSDAEVVATVNGVPIYKDELKGRKVNDLITEEVLYQKGLGLGLDEKYEQKIRDYRKQLIVHELKTDILENQPPEKEVSDDDIKAYYDNNQKKYTFIRMREVAFADKSLGDEIHSRVKSGEDLSEIVNSYTEPGSKVVGLDLGYNREMVHKFDKIEVGAVTEVIEKPDGTFGVVKIIEVSPIPLKQSERPIRRLLEAKRKGKAYENYANQIIEENNVDVEIINN